MDEVEARRRLAVARVGALATVTPGGWPHVVPVVFALVDDVLYTAVDRKPKTTTALQRLANIEATGRASVLVDEYNDDWSTLWWVRVDGSAQVLALDSKPESDADDEADDERRRTVLTRGQASPVQVAIEALTDKYPQYVDQPPTGPVIAVRLTRLRWWEAAPTP